MPRKSLQENRRQNPPRFIQQKSPTHCCRGAGSRILVPTCRPFQGISEQTKDTITLQEQCRPILQASCYSLVPSCLVKKASARGMRQPRRRGPFRHLSRMSGVELVGNRRPMLILSSLTSEDLLMWLSFPAMAVFCTPVARPEFYRERPTIHNGSVKIGENLRLGLVCSLRSVLANAFCPASENTVLDDPFPARRLLRSPAHMC